MAGYPKGRQALHCGLIKRIGNGESTNIWQDRWILGAIGGKPICPKLGASVVQVNELLSADDWHWDDGALQENLLYMDGQAVRRIPLGRLQHDFWLWAGERHGVY